MKPTEKFNKAVSSAVPERKSIAGSVDKERVPMTDIMEHRLVVYNKLQHIIREAFIYIYPEENSPK